jgi:hypothetical protein
MFSVVAVGFTLLYLSERQRPDKESLLDVIELRLLKFTQDNDPSLLKLSPDVAKAYKQHFQERYSELLQDKKTRELIILAEADPAPHLGSLVKDVQMRHPEWVQKEYDHHYIESLVERVARDIEVEQSIEISQADVDKIVEAVSQKIGDIQFEAMNLEIAVAVNMNENYIRDQQKQLLARVRAHFDAFGISKPTAQLGVLPPGR